MLWLYQMCVFINYRWINTVGRPAVGRRATTGRGRRSSTAAVRVSREQDDAEHDNGGGGDDAQQDDGRRSVIAAGRGSGPASAVPVPFRARQRRLVVEGTGTVDYSVAHGPGGQAQALVSGARERALIVAAIGRRPPGRAQRTVLVLGQVRQLGPRDFELGLVRVSVAHEPDADVPPTPAAGAAVSRRLADGRRRRLGRLRSDRDLFDVFGRQQRQVFDGRSVMAAHRHERIVGRSRRQVHLQAAVPTNVRHEVYLQQRFVITRS